MTGDPTCRSCQAPIVFAAVSNQSGLPPSYMPLDPDPNPGGNVAAYLDDTRTLRGRVLGKDDHPAAHETLYMPHFATCPKADQHRRRQRGQWTSANSQLARQRRRGRGGRPQRFDFGPGSIRLPGDHR